MYGCESWTVKKAEHQRIMPSNCCAGKDPESPLDSKVIKPVNLKEINPENSLEKSLMLGKTEGRRRRGHQRIKWLDDITDEMDMNLGKLWEMVRDRKAWRAAIHGVAKSWT